jgi:hypothetical protein
MTSGLASGAAALLLAVASTAAAQTSDTAPELATWLSAAEISGSMRAAYWSSSRHLDDEGHVAAWTARPKASPRLPGRASLLIDTWAHAVGPESDGDARLRTREALVRASAGPFDVRLGRQIIAWGRADGINPTDNLTPRDTTLLVADDEDERMGTTSAVVSYHAGGVSFTGVWLPEFRPPRFAVPLPAGVTLRRLDHRWSADQWAARIEQSGGAVDWSVSFLRGQDLTPTIGVSSNGGFTIQHQPVRVVGADAATTLGRFGARVEAAYVDTDDRDGVDPAVRNPYLHVVAGVDRTWREYLNVNVQYVFRRVSGDMVRSGGDAATEGLASLNTTIRAEARRYQHGGTVRIAHQWLRETLQGEVAAVVFAEPYGLLVRPRASYAVTDRLQVSVGADVMRGEHGSTLGLLRRNSAVLTELRWDF